MLAVAVVEDLLNVIFIDDSCVLDPDVPISEPEVDCGAKGPGVTAVVDVMAEAMGGKVTADGGRVGEMVRQHFLGLSSSSGQLTPCDVQRPVGVPNEKGEGGVSGKGD